MKKNKIDELERCIWNTLKKFYEHYSQCNYTKNGKTIDQLVEILTFSHNEMYKLLANDKTVINITENCVKDYSGMPLVAFYPDFDIEERVLGDVYEQYIQKVVECLGIIGPAAVYPVITNIDKIKLENVHIISELFVNYMSYKRVAKVIIPKLIDAIFDGSEKTVHGSLYELHKVALKDTTEPYIYEIIKSVSVIDDDMFDGTELLRHKSQVFIEVANRWPCIATDFFMTEGVSYIINDIKLYNKEELQTFLDHIEIYHNTCFEKIKKFLSE